MQTTVENIEPILKEFKQEIRTLYGKQLVSLILYGSYSEGRANETSDIDILVVLSALQSPYTEIRRMSDIKYRLLEKYEKIISTVPTTIELFNKMEVPLYKIIKKYGIEI